MLYSCSAQISIVSVDPVNSTAVTVTWISTSLNGSIVDHYTVHYSGLDGSGIVSSGTVTFPASASSGVVSGLQEGQQYQFSVSVSISVNGQIYNSTPSEPKIFFTGIQCVYVLKKLLSVSSVIVPNIIYVLAYKIIVFCSLTLIQQLQHSSLSQLHSLL